MINTSQIVRDWIEAGNQYDTETYVSYFDDNAIIDEHSVGTKIKGKKEIRKYFETYFIGYETHTTITKLTLEDAQHISIEIHFSGNFPQKDLDGWFHLAFNDAGDKIVFADTGFVE